VNLMGITVSELASALKRGVRQLVFIGGAGPKLQQFDKYNDASLQLFTVGEQEPDGPAATFVRTHFSTEKLSAALSRTNFDEHQPSFFVWLGDSGYRTLEDALSALSFIASLPKGSGIVFDYAPEHRSGGSLAGAALDSLASHISCASGAVKYLIQPQAVAAMLRSLGFGNTTDHIGDEVSPLDRHIISALV
jgi:O-methyltransferase involved in polyketide biosynthesis